jgi:hypothetical protein
VRSQSKAGAAPATVIDRDPRITAPLNRHCAQHGKASAVRVDSPETGLTDSTGVAEGSTVKRGCLSLRLFLPSSKALNF